MKITDKTALVCVAPFIFGATVTAAYAKDHRSALAATIDFSPSSICKVSFVDRTFSLPAQKDDMIEVLRKLKRSRGSISIRSAVKAPYRCVGQVIYLMQYAGFEKVGFVAQPPNP